MEKILYTVLNFLYSPSHLKQHTAYFSYTYVLARVMLFLGK